LANACVSRQLKKSLVALCILQLLVVLLKRTSRIVQKTMRKLVQFSTWKASASIKVSVQTFRLCLKRLTSTKPCSCSSFLTLSLDIATASWRYVKPMKTLSQNRFQWLFGLAALLAQEKALRHHWSKAWIINGRPGEQVKIYSGFKTTMGSKLLLSTILERITASFRSCWSYWTGIRTQ